VTVILKAKWMPPHDDFRFQMFAENMTKFALQSVFSWSRGPLVCALRIVRVDGATIRLYCDYCTVL